MIDDLVKEAKQEQVNDDGKHTTTQSLTQPMTRRRCLQRVGLIWRRSDSHTLCVFECVKTGASCELYCTVTVILQALSLHVICADLIVLCCWVTRVTNDVNVAWHAVCCCDCTCLFLCVFESSPVSPDCVCMHVWFCVFQRFLVLSG